MDLTTHQGCIRVLATCYHAINPGTTLLIGIEVACHASYSFAAGRKGLYMTVRLKILVSAPSCLSSVVSVQLTTRHFQTYISHTPSPLVRIASAFRSAGGFSPIDSSEFFCFASVFSKSANYPFMEGVYNMQDPTPALFRQRRRPVLTGSSSYRLRPAVG